MMEYTILLASVFMGPLSSALKFSVTFLPYGSIIVPFLFLLCLSVICTIVRHFRCHSIESDTSLACKIMKKLGQGRWTRVFEYDHVQGDDRPTIIISIWPLACARATCDQSESGAKKVNARVYCSDALWRAVNVDDCVAKKMDEEVSTSSGDAANKKDLSVIPKLVKNIENQYTYYSRVLSMFYYNICPNSDQALIVEKIISIYDSRKQCCAFIEGPPGTGKSSIASLLCTKLDGVLCPFDPTRPGESFSEMKAAAENTCEGKVLVLLMDETDAMLHAVRNGKVEQNVYTRTLATDKTGWNSLMDQLGSERGIIVIMTSNTPKHRLDEEETRTGQIDRFLRKIRRKGKAVASNLRPGRVHAVFRCSTKTNSDTNGYIHDVKNTCPVSSNSKSR